MVAYSFKRQFVAPITAGNKAQTMRNDRKRHARVGETLQLYTGMRTKACTLIGTAICSAVLPVRIDFERPSVEIPGRVITKRHGRHTLDRFALDDGFDDWGALVDFWRREHAAITTWSGVLIRWSNFEEAPPW